jgi:hypothetical protein
MANQSTTMVVDQFTQDPYSTYEAASNYPLSLANGYDNVLTIDMVNIPANKCHSVKLVWTAISGANAVNGSAVCTLGSGTDVSYTFAGTESLVANDGYYKLHLEVNPTAVTIPPTVWRSKSIPCGVTG